MKKIAFVVLVIFCVAKVSYAQKPDQSKFSVDEKKEFEIANVLFQDKQYQSSYHHLKPIFASHSDDIGLKYMVGVCGIWVHAIHEDALNYLEEVKTKNPKAKNIDLYITMLYHKNYQFDKALEGANKLLADPKLDPHQKEALEKLIVYSKNGKVLMENPVAARIDNLGSAPNSEGAEYSPVISSDEEKIVFTYRGKESMGGLMDAKNNPDPKGDFNEDIFMSKKVDGKWQKPEPVAGINTIDNDAVIALSNDQKQMFLYKYNETGKGDIYISQWDGEKFWNPEPLKGEVNTPNWEGSASLSIDQRKLYFSSDRPGGFGGKDLYVASKMADGSYSNVKNLGNKVNTALDEDAPFIHPDGRTLVFSSEGHNTMGDHDIFSSDMDEVDSSWKAAVNLGYPINTTDDDLFYVLSADGKRGYYSSEKKGGSGDHDIYVVEPGIISKKTYLTVIKGKVTENLFPIEANIDVSVSSDGRKYTSIKSNAESGHYVIDLPSGYNYKITIFHPVFGDKTFDIVAEKIDGYAEKIVNVNFGMSDTASTDHQTILLNNKPAETPVVASTPAPTETLPTGQAGKTETNSTKGSEPIAFSVNEKVDDMTDEQIVIKFGAVKVNDLKYMVQVGAYRHPENYQSKFLNQICSVKKKGKIKGDITLLVADREFDNLNDAHTFLTKIKDAGQKDAFITADLNGKRHYLKDLLKKSVWFSKPMVVN